MFESARTFNNIFFDGKKELITKIDFFLKNRKWYYEKGIPYSLGIGLHGPPGTGKTSLIKALSGTLTTRHSSEKTKNITIKLGFANWKYYDGKNNLHHISFVDCPGHHEYINTMLSGINIIDGLLLLFQ